jgi:hypothetical protein
VLELMCAAAGDEGMRPGMVAVVQTAGDLVDWQRHVPAIVSLRAASWSSAKTLSLRVTRLYAW